MHSIENLKATLGRIDGKGYNAYKDLEGAYEFRWFTLHVDHAQGDPFASPSRLRARVPMQRAGYPRDVFNTRIRRIAFEDFVTRRTAQAVFRETRRKEQDAKGPTLIIDTPGQEVLERTCCRITNDWVEVRFYMNLPAAGRRILGRQARDVLCERIPEIIQKGLLWRSYSQKEPWAFVECVENQETIREKLDAMGLIAFIADGAVLPRESGVSQRPLARKEAVPFKSPDSLRVSIELPNPMRYDPRAERRITGMGVPKGVTLIVGGGYHGKSTLLKALERGVYPHVPGDGREYVVTTRRAVKIRAEEGRRVQRVDISPFIGRLPGGRDTRSFSTENASGSTSQAANIMEALEMGADALLLDEDTSATNFMVRDVRMQTLVPRENEPITAFIDRVREIHDSLGVSTVLVMGGCGDYFDVADLIVMMKEYAPSNVTEEARKVAAIHDTGRSAEAGPDAAWRMERIPLPAGFDSSLGKKRVKIEARGLDWIQYGAERIDVRDIEQIVDICQSRSVGVAIHLAATRFLDGKVPLRTALERLEGYLDENGMDLLDPYFRGETHPGSFARPRSLEIAAAVNRLRSVKFRG